MPVDPLEVLKAKATIIRDTLSAASDKTKAERVSVQFANDFNRLLTDVGASCPAIAQMLPSQITANGPFARVGQADCQYTDAMIWANQIISMLQIAKNAE
jgi:hypothetical protein